jgi:DNA-binding response OmpR family regulator
LTAAQSDLDYLVAEQRHILVVEDERTTLTLIEKILDSAGYRVTGVLDGIAAIKAARTDPPDLVLLDLIIPGVDGYGVCALLKRNRSFHAPIVVLTGRTSDKDVKAALGAGADAVMPKPVDRQALLSKISELLSPQGRSSSDPTP